MKVERCCRVVPGMKGSSAGGATKPLDWSGIMLLCEPAFSS